MTHEEEEMQHDLSKLWDHAQQFSLSQRTTKDELEAVNVKMDDLEEKNKRIHHMFKGRFNKVATRNGS